MNENLFARLRRRFPCDSRVVIDAGRPVTYGDLDRATAAYAGLFASLGLKPGARLASVVDKSPESLFLYLACLRFGLIYLPLNTAYRRRELGYFFTDAEPALVVGRPADEKTLAALVPPDAFVYTMDSTGGGSFSQAAAAAAPLDACRDVRGDDTASIVYTSGTTGRPKGAMITHGNLAANADTLVEAWGFTGDDVLLHVLPLFHVHGLFVACHCVLWSGARMHFAAGTGSSNILRGLPEATVMMGVPTHYTRLLDEKAINQDACRSIRLFISGSAPLLPATFTEFEARTGHRILERYGMTETGMNTSNPLDGPRRPGTVGPPLPGVDVRIVKPDGNMAGTGETGVLQVKGPNVFKGYWRQPDKTAAEFTEDGYFITGDLASRDDDGYIRIEGRHKDLIISGGYNVYPAEVEACINNLPEVLESAVIGLPHPDYGEAVCAVVVPQSGNAPTGTSIINHVKSDLASYKAPKSVHFVDELPRNTMGKVRKSVLRERFSE